MCFQTPSILLGPAHMSSCGIADTDDGEGGASTEGSACEEEDGDAEVELGKVVDEMAESSSDVAADSSSALVMTAGPWSGQQWWQ